MCGADSVDAWDVERNNGSSPRVRSRLSVIATAVTPVRIISACAEQTPSRTPRTPNCWDHLRVCGADGTAVTVTGTHGGSSPRVRSRQVPNQSEGADHGIISACAEQTAPTITVSRAPTDHLRVCGADFPFGCDRCRRQGSSPRVRSRLGRGHDDAHGGGIISACAEQTRWAAIRAN